MASMDNTDWDQVDNYLAGLLVGDDDVLTGTLQASREAGLPAINVSPLQGKFLHILARLMGARRVLEVGALGGYSAIWVGRALPPPPDGRLISLEVDHHHAAVARANISNAGLSGTVEVIVGPALESLPRVARDYGPDSFDLAFIDADKPNNAAYYRWALQLVRPGGAIVVDNVVRSGKVADAESTDPSIVGTRQLFETMARLPEEDLPGVAATALQTVGAKGYDGFSISIVDGPTAGSGLKA
jgi:predicted O-methyltransferase YrrM